MKDLKYYLRLKYPLEQHNAYLNWLEAFNAYACSQDALVCLQVLHERFKDGGPLPGHL
jgi:hypothetical protein